MPARSTTSRSCFLGTGDDLTVTNSSLTFTGILSLTRGGINVAGGDLSPAGNSAKVVVNVGGVVEPPITGSFNDDEVEYDLTYIGTTGGPVYQAGSEFDTDFLRNLEVAVTSTTVNVAAGVGGDGTISGNVIVRNGGAGQGILRLNGQDIVVNGSTRVEDQGAINLRNDGADDATYTVSTADNVLDGRISGDGTLILRDGVTITGTQTAITGTLTPPQR